MSDCILNYWSAIVKSEIFPKISLTERNGKDSAKSCDMGRVRLWLWVTSAYVSFVHKDSVCEHFHVRNCCMEYL